MWKERNISCLIISVVMSFVSMHKNDESHSHVLYLPLNERLSQSVLFHMILSGSSHLVLIL